MINEKNAFGILQELHDENKLLKKELDKRKEEVRLAYTALSERETEITEQSQIIDKWEERCKKLDNQNKILHGDIISSAWANRDGSNDKQATEAKLVVNAPHSFASLNDRIERVENKLIKYGYY